MYWGEEREKNKDGRREGKERESLLLHDVVCSPKQDMAGHDGESLEGPKNSRKQPREKQTYLINRWMKRVMCKKKQGDWKQSGKGLCAKKTRRLETVWQFLRKLNREFPLSQQFHSQIHIQAKWKTEQHKYLYAIVYSSIICNAQKMKTTQMPIN